jgi:hypothetical protein
VPRYGETGEVVIQGGAGASLSYTNHDESDAESVDARLTPSLDYFVFRDVSIGLELRLSYSEDAGYGVDDRLIRNRFGFGGGAARLGVNFPLGRYVSLHPAVSFGVHRIEESAQYVRERARSWRTVRTGPYVEVTTPLLLHVAPRFFVGLRPYYYRDLARAQRGPDAGSNQSVLGVGVLVGGYIGGPSEPEAEEHDRPAPGRRFGAKGSFVLSTFASWARRVSSSRTNRGRISIVVVPGFDWFYDQNQSVGFAVGISHSEGVGFDPTEREIDFRRQRIGARVRYGVNAPVSDRVSFVPGASLGYGTTSHSIRSDGDERSFDSGGVDVSLDGKLLVHFDHLFVGFGATFAHDLTRHIDGIDVQNRSTTLGVGTLAGGWF